MKEQNKGEPISVEGWRHNISELASKSEFGTPQFQALCDYYNLANLAEQTKDIDSSQFVVDGHLSHLPHETRVEVILQQIVLLNHTIEQKRSNIPGYAKTYDSLAYSFDQLEEESSLEAKTNYPEEPSQQTTYVHKVYTEMLGSISEDIYLQQISDNQTV